MHCTLLRSHRWRQKRVRELPFNTIVPVCLYEREYLHLTLYAEQAEDRAAELEEKLRSAEAEFKLAEGLFTSTHEESQATLVAAQNAKLRADEEALTVGKRLSEAERAAQEEKARREECVARLEAERDVRQKAEIAAEERLAAASAQLESAEANLQRITAHGTIDS